LNYRIYRNIDSIETIPSLPCSFGEQSISVSPKGLLGGKKWKGGGNREVSSVLVLNDEACSLYGPVVLWNDEKVY